MEISVIVPVYKVEAYLSRCIDSILAQSFTDFELILVDDGSPDYCGKICDKYASKDARIRVIHQQNGGAASARNAGIDIAKGEWLAFIDSDDWVHPDYLKMLFEAVKEFGADVSACRYKTVEDGTQVNNGSETALISAENAEEYWVKDRTGAVVPWGKLYKSELFEALRFPDGVIGEDEFVSYKVLFGCNKLIVMDNVLYYYFDNRDGVSKSNYIKLFPDALRAFAEHIEFFKNSPWQKAYRLEVEKYAEAYSNAIWLLKGQSDEESKKETDELRTKLRAYMETHKAMIPFEQRKDIYISAYPSQEIFIRGFGFIKQKLNSAFGKADT